MPGACRPRRRVLVRRGFSSGSPALLTQREPPEHDCRWQLCRLDRYRRCPTERKLTPLRVRRSCFGPSSPQRGKSVNGGAAGYRPRVRSVYCVRLYRHSSFRNDTTLVLFTGKVKRHEIGLPPTHAHVQHLRRDGRICITNGRYCPCLPKVLQAEVPFPFAEAQSRCCPVIGRKPCGRPWAGD